MEQELTASSPPAFNDMEQAPDTQHYRDQAVKRRPSLADILTGEGGKDGTPGGSNTDAISEAGESTASGKSGKSGHDQASGTTSAKELAANAKAVADAASAAETVKTLTWWDGVMIPCLLNIWGVIMFLRLGWVVGQAGILLGTAIITLSNIVTGITALSLFAICTNGEVKGGGAYYLISRSLGPLYGGVIGLLFFIAQAVACSMYVIGFSDSVNDIFKKGGGAPFTGAWENDQRVISVVTMVVLLVTALSGGASLYAKCQILLLIALVIAMFAIFAGAFVDYLPDEQTNVEFGFVGFDGSGALVSNGTTSTIGLSMETNVWLPQWSTDPTTQISHSFFTVFAVFFPAVTGIMAGANMSGDLVNPSEDIPKGTTRAIGLTYVTYVGLLWILGFTSMRCADVDMTKCPTLADAAWAQSITEADIPGGGLLYNKIISTAHSLWAPLVYVGVFAATLSSALASIVGAPRILQSLASDKIFPWPILEFFAKGSGAGNEPNRGYVLTFFIGTGCCLIGQLDVIAPIIANFFMISYAITNYACFAASESKSPSWRPTFQYYNPWLSLFGAGLCIVAMFLMDWANSLVSCFVGLGIFGYLNHIKPDTNWGPAGEARKYLTALRGMEALTAGEVGGKGHVKTFRPQLLFMSGHPENRPSLLGLAHALRAARGAMVMGNVILNEATPVPAVAEEEKKNAIEEYAKRKDLANKDVVRSDKVRDDMYTYLYRTNTYAAELKKSGLMCDVVCADDLLSGFGYLLQLGGLGGLRPNTVVLGYKSDWRKASDESLATYEAIIHNSLVNNRGIMIVRDPANVFASTVIDPDAIKALEASASAKEVEVEANADGEAEGDEGDDTVAEIRIHSSKKASEGKIHVSTARSMSTATNLTKNRFGKAKTEKRRIDVWWLADVSDVHYCWCLYCVGVVLVCCRGVWMGFVLQVPLALKLTTFFVLLLLSPCLL
jgi:solute carrier family 12 sodium/potassium/chloride transporter 2